VAPRHAARGPAPPRPRPEGLPPPRPPPKRLRLVVGPAEAGLSVLELLQRRGGLTADLARAALGAGGLFLDRKRLTRDAPVVSGSELVAHLSERGRAPNAPRALDADRLLLLDDSVIAVDKPPLLAAQGTLSSATAGIDTALEALLRGRGERNCFVGLVHRLDLETSGVTLFGRTPGAVSHLTRQFRERAPDKRYRALVMGRPPDAFEVDAPLGPDLARPGHQSVSSRGRPARTRFAVLRRFEAGGACAALVEAAPLTGRTHQIRVHAAHAGHPLLGDPRYGGPTLLSPFGRPVVPPRVALHALRLEFVHPDGGHRSVEAPWPSDLAQLEADLVGVTSA
jgi:23S rRNA pseudouridine1911/1915/1917 synthase